MKQVFALLCLAALAFGASSQEKPRIFLDPGHGGEDKGVRAAGGMEEAALCLEIAKEVQKRLKERGIPSQLSREDNSEGPLPSQRAQRANASGAKLFVSLHINHSPNPSARGARLFVPKPGAPASADSPLAWSLGAGGYGEASKALANSLASALAPGASSKPPVQQLQLAAFRGLAMPAVLIELGYASHVESLERLNDPEWRSHTALKLSESLGAFLRSSAAAP